MDNNIIPERLQSVCGCRFCENAVAIAVEWGERNHVVFDNPKNEMLDFTRCQKSNLRQRLAEARMTVRGHIFGFNGVATQWLRVYLDTELQFRAHKNLSLEKE